MPRPPIRPLRQEQEPATTDIDEVAPGVLRLQLPIKLPGLGHVNCYALEDERGFALVDPGLPGPMPWRLLKDRLERADIPLARVHTVVVTHSHPDHFGAAGRLRKVTGADIVTHASFRTWWDPREDDDGDVMNDDALVTPVPSRRPGRPQPPWGQPTPWGGEGFKPPLTRRAGFRLMHRFRRFFGTPEPSSRVEDADVLRLGRREWIAVHTPGHTPDHLCLLDPVDGVLISGDHVLPTITPHISGLSLTADPLADFFRSLELVGELSGVQRVLPAHGHPFDDLAGRTKAIRRHHEERLDVLRVAASELGPAKVADLSHRLFREAVWGPMAESETYAHLEHLRLGGEASRWAEGDHLLYAMP